MIITNNLSSWLSFQNKMLFLFYADPGSGALIWQLLLAAFFGLIFYARFYYRKMKALVSLRKDVTEAKEQTTLETPPNNAISSSQTSSSATQRND